MINSIAALMFFGALVFGIASARDFSSAALRAFMITLAGIAWVAFGPGGA